MTEERKETLEVVLEEVVDYTMPLRIMVYDGMNYTKELKDIEGEVGKKKEHMKITPIITIVMYYGKKAWDGPVTLKEMMADIPENLADYVSDYKMNLVEVLHDEDYEFQNDDVKMLFDYSQAIVKKVGREAEKARGAKAIVNLLRGFNSTAEEIVEALIRELGIKEEEARKFL